MSNKSSVRAHGRRAYILYTPVVLNIHGLVVSTSAHPQEKKPVEFRVSLNPAVEVRV